MLAVRPNINLNLDPSIPSDAIYLKPQRRAFTPMTRLRTCFLAETEQWGRELFTYLRARRAATGLENSHGRGILLFLLCLLPCAAEAAQPIHYDVDLTAPDAHLVHVTMNIPDAGPDAEIQIPTWNCLYQIRDFVKNVADLKGDCDGQAVGLGREDLNTWRGPGHPCGSLNFHYSVYAATDGPFDSMLDGDHAFLNLAMVLFYLPHERTRPVHVTFQVPSGWKLATFVEGDGHEFQAANYDALVDSPVEAGHFEEFSYAQDFIPASAPPAATKHATIRLIVDADRTDYSPERILPSVQKITAEETALMQDLPFVRYTFILHFPRGSGSTGGMEHRNGTAIAVAASNIKNNDSYLEDVFAHELFHAVERQTHSAPVP